MLRRSQFAHALLLAFLISLPAAAAQTGASVGIADAQNGFSTTVGVQTDFGGGSYHARIGGTGALTLYEESNRCVGLQESSSASCGPADRRIATIPDAGLVPAATYEDVGVLVVGAWLIVLDQYEIVLALYGSAWEAAGHAYDDAWAAGGRAYGFAWCEAGSTWDRVWGGAGEPCQL